MQKKSDSFHLTNIISKRKIILKFKTGANKSRLV